MIASLDNSCSSGSSWIQDWATWFCRTGQWKWIIISCFCTVLESSLDRLKESKVIVINEVKVCPTSYRLTVLTPRLIALRWGATVNLITVSVTCIIKSTCIFLICRSSILSEVSTRSSSKLPSGKNILIFGEYWLLVWKSMLLQFICAGQPWEWEKGKAAAKSNDCTFLNCTLSCLTPTPGWGLN